MILIEKVDVMSLIIAVCGTNFCSFVADNRLVRYKGFYSGPKFVSDNYQKIFKINDRILLGVAGKFYTEFDPLAPLKVYPDKSVLTMRMAAKAIIDDFSSASFDMVSGLKYMVGGKDNKGRFCICEITPNHSTGIFQAEWKYPNPPAQNFAVSVALPSSLLATQNELLDEVETAITSNTRHDQMMKDLGLLVRKTADKDMTVGKKVTYLTVS